MARQDSKENLGYLMRQSELGQLSHHAFSGVGVTLLIRPVIHCYTKLIL